MELSAVCRLIFVPVNVNEMTTYLHCFYYYSFLTANSISAGQLLCGGLFSADSLSNWCAAVALAHALQDNLTQKEQLLRVQLATSLGKPPVSLLQQCTNILSQVGMLIMRHSAEPTEVLTVSGYTFRITVFD